MAFPSVRSSNANSVAGQTGISVPMPGTIVAGDLLLLLIRVNATATITSAPTGFTLLDDNLTANFIAYLYGKVAVGGDTATFNASAVNGFSVVTAAIQNWWGTLAGVEVTNLAENVVDPPSITASWGSADNLFVVPASTAGTPVMTVTGWPANYTEIAQTSGDFSTDVCAGLSSRQLAAATDNPGVVTFSGGNRPLVGNVVIRPSAAGDPANLQASVAGDDVTLTWDV